MSATVQEARTRLMWAYFHTFAFQTAAPGTDPGFSLAPLFQRSLEREIYSEVGGVRRTAGKESNIATFVFGGFISSLHPPPFTPPPSIVSL